MFSTNNIFSQDVIILFPTNETKIIPGQSINIQWINTTNNPVNLYYKIDENNWELIAGSLTDNNYDWIMPESIGLTVTFKITYEILTPPELFWHESDVSESEIRSGKFTPSGNFIVIGSKDGKVKLYDFNKRVLISEIDLSYIAGLSYQTPINDSLVFVSLNTYVAIVDVLNKKIIGNVVNIGSEVREVDYTPKNGGMFVTSSKDKNVYLFDNELNYIKHFTSNGDSVIYSVRFSDDASKVCFSNYTGNINCYDIFTDLYVFSEISSPGSTSNLLVWSVDLNPQNTLLVSGGVDNIVRVWDFETGNELKQFANHSRHVRHLRFSKNRNIFMSGSLDGTIRQYNSNDLFEYENVAINHLSSVLSVDYNYNSEYIISSGMGRDFKVWKNFEIESGEKVVTSTIIRTFEIYIPDITVNLNEDFRIPVLTNLSNQGSVFSKDKYLINLKIEIPSTIVSINEFPQTIPGASFDTLDFEVEYTIKNDTLLGLGAFSLLGPQNYGQLRILEVSSENELLITTDDGSITISGDCPADYSRGITVSGNPSKVNISPNPASEYIQLELNILEDDYYSINAIDNLGKVSILEEKRYFRSGSHNLKIDVDILNNGVYILSLSNKNVIFTEKFIIKR